MGRFRLYCTVLCTFLAALCGIIPVDLSGVCMIAHRGYSGFYHQNSREAFEKAGKAGFGGAETDVRMTSDGVFVLSHGDYIELYDGTKMTVADHTYAELTEKPLQNSNTPTHLRICTLKEYLEVCKQYGMICFIELKDEWPPEKIVEVFQYVRQYYDLSMCEFQSFEMENLLVAHEAFPDLRIMLTCGPYNETVEQAWTLGFDIDMAYEFLSREIVEKFHEEGLLVAAYTANSPAKVVYCASLGVDFIESDYISGRTLCDRLNDKLHETVCTKLCPNS